MSAATMSEIPPAVKPGREPFWQHLRFKLAEYTDLAWFDVLGRLPVIGDRLREYRSGRNFRRG